MILGVTGTRHIDKVGRNRVLKFKDFISSNNVTEFHHGDCTGWDQITALICITQGIEVVAHPPTSDEFRAFVDCDLVLPPKPYLDRNKDIVGAIDFLIAAPDGPERQRSGTWSTVRYAKKVGVKGVIWP